MTTALAIVELETEDLVALPRSKSEQIRAVFVPMADTLKGFEDRYNSVMAEAAEGVTPDVSARARRLRLDIAKVRIETEKRRKDIKAEYVLAGRAIDGVANILRLGISGQEEALEDIEKHAERVEAERIRTLQAERVELLAPYVDDAAGRQLGSLDADVWEAYLAGRKQSHADRIEAERRAEAERAERERVRAAEAEAIRAERDRLAKEAEKKERARRAELRAIEKEREAERALIAAEREQERAAAAAERRRLEALEAQERDRLTQERADAEARAAEEAEAAAAPVRARLVAWVDRFALPDLPGEDHETADAIREKFEAFRRWARGAAAQAREPERVAR